MLLLASAGLLITFLLAIELSKGTKGAPAFRAAHFSARLAALLYAEHDGAAGHAGDGVHAAGAVAVLKKNYAAAAVASVVLVLVKETGIVAPFVFFIVLLRQKDFRRASYFIAPAAALLGSGWLYCITRRAIGSATQASRITTWAIR